MIVNNPLISICVPCHNGEAFIADTLKSLCLQTYSNIEIIIINDHSKDNSEKIILEKAALDSRIRYYCSLPNRYGAGAARNQAILKAMGEYIVFCDADDLLNEEYIWSQYNAISDKPNCISACKGVTFIDNDFNKQIVNKRDTWQDLAPIDWLLINNGQGLEMTWVGLFLIPRSLILKTEGWNENLSLIDDFEYFPRLLLTSEKIIFNNTAIYFYRAGNAGSLSNSTSKTAALSAFNAIKLTTKTLLTYENSERVKLVLAKYIKQWIYNFYPNEMQLYTLLLKDWGNLTDRKYSPTNGGLTHILDRIIGWKLTKKIKIKWNAR